VFYPVPETGTRKTGTRLTDWRHTCKFLVPDNWYQVLVRVSPALRVEIHDLQTWLSTVYTLHSCASDGTATDNIMDTL